MALQFTNGDVELAKAELLGGLFHSLFKRESSSSGSIIGDSSSIISQQQPKPLPALLELQQPILDNNDGIPQKSVLEGVNEEEEEAQLKSSVPLRASISTDNSTDEDTATALLEEDEEDSALLDEQQLSISDRQDEDGQGTELVHADEGESSEAKAANDDDDENDVSYSVQIDRQSGSSQVLESVHTGGESSSEAKLANNDDENDVTTVPIYSESLPQQEESKVGSGEIRESHSDESKEVSALDISQSALLEAIHMRGLKNSIANHQVGGNDNRSSLLIEIRNKTPTKQVFLQQHPSMPSSPTEEEEDAATIAINDSENVDPADKQGIDDNAALANEEKLDISDGIDEQDDQVVPVAKSTEPSPAEPVNDIDKVDDGDVIKENESTPLDESNTAELPPPLNKDPVYEKYYHMLKMGLPMGAVQNAMLRDELDPSVLDFDPEKSLESQRPIEKKSDSVVENQHTVDETTNDDGMENQQQQKNDKSANDNDECLTPGSAWASRLGFPSDWQAPATNNDKALPEFPVNDDEIASENGVWEEEGPSPLNKDPTYEKYYRMLKMVSIVCYLFPFLGIVQYWATKTCVSCF